MDSANAMNGISQSIQQGGAATGYVVFLGHGDKDGFAVDVGGLQEVGTRLGRNFFFEDDGVIVSGLFAPEVTLLSVCPLRNGLSRLYEFTVSGGALDFLIAFLHALTHRRRGIVCNEGRRDEDNEFALVAGIRCMAEETPDDGEISQERDLRYDFRIFGIDEASDRHGHAGADIDFGLGLAGRDARYAEGVDLDAMTVVQGRYFGMDLRGDLVFRVDDRPSP